MTIANKPDLIFMDVQMPEMSGIEATVKIRNFENGKPSRIPIVALTAGAVKGEKEKCLAAGMDDFLTKPIDREALHKILETHLTSFTEKAGIPSGKTSSTGTILHFDEQMLMENIDNSQIVLNELLDVVPLQFSYDMEALGKAIAEKDLAEIKRATHSIKGASLNMCFIQLAELAKEIELNIERHKMEKLDALFHELVLEWEKIQLIILQIRSNPV
jgi:CheY-like chemotaxis protein